jgi:hypothetical protein
VPEIVPVEFTLPSGQWVTLYQRDWDDADDDSLAFLGGDDHVYAFATAEELAAYAGANDEHHLGPSSLWPEVQRRFRPDFAPAPGDRFDLRTPTERGQDMLAELLVYLRMEVPEGDWNMHPLARALPQNPSPIPVYTGADYRLPDGGTTLWEWAVSEVDARVGNPPVAGSSDLVLAMPVEEVASGVESLWVGLDDAGAHTLVVRDDEAGWVFLGEPGRVVAAGSAAGLMAFVCHGHEPLLDTEPWQALRGRDDLDFEPYEDNVVDLDELGRSLGPGLDRAGAEALLDARLLVQELAIWLGIDDIAAAFDEDQPLGRFFVRDLLDLVTGSAKAPGRLRDTDFEPITASWQACVSRVASRVHWVE